jgi:hypothetical protein
VRARGEDETSTEKEYMQLGFRVLWFVWFSLQLHKRVTCVGSPSFCSALSKHLAEGSSREPPSSAVKMAEFKPQAVKDVPANDFIKAYAAHLKSTDKVSNLQPSHTWSQDSGGFFSRRTCLMQLWSDWCLLWWWSAGLSSRSRHQHRTQQHTHNSRITCSLVWSTSAGQGVAWLGGSGASFWQQSECLDALLKWIVLCFCLDCSCRFPIGSTL